MVEHISNEGELLAIIIPASFQEPGVHFFTKPEFSQQIGYMHYGSGKRIEPHLHLPVSREVHLTQEVIFLRKGKLRVDLYSHEKKYLFSRILAAGDAILLIQGGHGFEVLEPVEMIEVKQGPYAGEGDKERFPAIASAETRLP
jgi:mannose-6-phosphate isomerase-like protein (cupin superfamily)